VSSVREQRIPTAQVTEMVAMTQEKEEEGGLVDGTNVLVVEQDKQVPQAVVQTSKSNLYVVKRLRKDSADAQHLAR